MKKTIELGAVLFSLLLWSCGGNAGPQRESQGRWRNRFERDWPGCADGSRTNSRSPTSVPGVDRGASRRQLAPLRGIQPHPAIEHCFTRPELRVWGAQAELGQDTLPTPRCSTSGLESLLKAGGYEPRRPVV